MEVSESANYQTPATKENNMLRCCCDSCDSFFLKILFASGKTKTYLAKCIKVQSNDQFDRQNKVPIMVLQLSKEKTVHSGRNRFEGDKKRKS